MSPDVTFLDQETTKRVIDSNTNLSIPIHFLYNLYKLPVQST